MANCNSKAAALFLDMALVLSFILVINVAEGRLILIGFGLLPKSSGPHCVSVYGAVKGDTCFSVA
ncbi:hypothetical protein SLEP1_g47049 [Rubroshorea leprosula]|uniref:Uncharacterized protein n=1 Tax=Rubroshorea leprosula TaxID=152421 RepID=A0AAV5LP74_9ROSI|nr:hypothetical protein SLEP1_g47049 [Rubroshorea leprosula]